MNSTQSPSHPAESKEEFLDSRHGLGDVGTNEATLKWTTGQLLETQWQKMKQRAEQQEHCTSWATALGIRGRRPYQRKASFISQLFTRHWSVYVLWWYIIGYIICHSHLVAFITTLQVPCQLVFNRVCVLFHRLISTISL